MRGLIITVTGVVVFVLTVCSAASLDCKDEWSATICWYNLNKCSQADYQSRCKKSCGICDNCKDLLPSLFCWNNVRRCNESFFQNNCQKTCGLCDGCTDIRDDCSLRKTRCGETWLLVGCRTTCGACHIQDTGGRETDDTMTTTTSTTTKRTGQKDNEENPNQIGNWGAWGAWGLCSATCGKGVTTRRRTCSPVGAECHGDNTNNADCLLTACCVPRDGSWGDWTDWSTCSSTCGGGFRTRSRKCNEPNSCGQPCQGKSKESTACYVQACPKSTTSDVKTDQPSIEKTKSIVNASLRVNATVFPAECSDNLTDCPRLATRCADSFVQEFCRKTCSRCHVHSDSSDAASMATMFSVFSFILH